LIPGKYFENPVADQMKGEVNILVLATINAQRLSLISPSVAKLTNAPVPMIPASEGDSSALFYIRNSLSNRRS